jgi:hypothetical protein
LLELDELCTRTSWLRGEIEGRANGAEDGVKRAEVITRRLVHDDREWLHWRIRDPREANGRDE